jgi:Flp pilus assembly protein TadD
MLIGCASSGGSGPAGETTTAAPPVDVDASTLAAYKRAVNAMKDGQTGNAISQFTAITKTHPNLAGPFINLGIIYINKGRYEDAEKNLLQATTIKPTDAVAQTHLGIAYRNLGKFDEAKAAYEAALKSNPKYPFAHLNAGILYDIYLNDLTRALRHYQQYQALTNGQDKTVDKWIVDLERRVNNKS